MKDFLTILTEGAAREAKLNRARQEGYDTTEIVYHGSTFDFRDFKQHRRITAAHIYTSPDLRTASFYGDNVYACVIRGKTADITDEGDYRVLKRLADEFADRFERNVYGDPELVEIQERVAERIREENDDLTQTEAEMEAEEDEEYIMVRNRVTREYAANYFQSGKLYDYDHRGHFQDEVLNFIFSLGYTNVRMFDYSSEGDPVSVVVDTADNITIIEKVRDAN